MTQSPEPVDAFQLLKALPSDPPNIRLLRFAVLGMGAILLVGFAAVIGRIVFLTMRSPSSTVSISSAGTMSTPLTSGGPMTTEIRLALPIGAKVRSQSLAGNRLAVHYDGPTGDEIMILDLESGRILSQIHLSPSAK
jgi:hypothetical protein